MTERSSEAAGVATDRSSTAYWRRLPPTVPVAVGVLAVETVGRWLLAGVVGLGVRPTGAVVVLGTIALGPAAAPGVFLGTLLAGLVTSGIVEALVTPAAVVVGIVLGGRAAADFGPRRAAGGVAWGLRYAFLASCVVCVVAATAGLLSGLFGVAPFQLVVGEFIATNLPLALVVAPLVRYTSRPFGIVDVDSGAEGPTILGTEPLSSARRRATVFGLVSVGWVAAGYSVGFVFRATEQVAAERIGNHLGPAAVRLIELAGPRGVFLQAAVGLVALALLAVSVRRS